MSAEYLAQLQKTDEAVGRLVALPAAGRRPSIITADHGGQLKSHGTNRSST